MQLSVNILHYLGRDVLIKLINEPGGAIATGSDSDPTEGSRAIIRHYAECMLFVMLSLILT